MEKYRALVYTENNRVKFLGSKFRKRRMGMNNRWKLDLKLLMWKWGCEDREEVKVEIIGWTGNLKNRDNVKKSDQPDSNQWPKDLLQHDHSSVGSAEDCCVAANP